MLRYFKSDCYIFIKTNSSGYIVKRVVSELIMETGKWHFVAYFWRKIKQAETWYKIHNRKLFAIVKAALP